MLKAQALPDLDICASNLIKMGQKVNPIGFRTGTFLPWKSRWFSDSGDYKDFLLEDIKIRRALMTKLKAAGITQVEIERLSKNMAIILTVSRPGVVIGRGGSGLEEIKKIPRGNELLDFVDMLVSGPFIEELRTESGLAGSTNQKIIFLTDRYSPKDIKLSGDFEIHLYPDGHLVMTGIVPEIGLH